MINNRDLILRQLTPPELEAGYRLICDASEWLNKRGILQWPTPLPKEIYQEWHSKNYNFGLFLEDKLLVVLSLVHQKHKFWEKFVSIGKVYWLSTVATSLKFKGNNLGKTAVKKACEYLEKNNIKEIYLDCIHGGGFLPNFYRQFGFKQVARKKIEYPTGIFDMVLMYKKILED